MSFCFLRLFSLAIGLVYRNDPQSQGERPGQILESNENGWGLLQVDWSHKLMGVWSCRSR